MTMWQALDNHIHTLPILKEMPAIIKAIIGYWLHVQLSGRIHN